MFLLIYSVSLERLGPQKSSFLPPSLLWPLTPFTSLVVPTCASDFPSVFAVLSPAQAIVVYTDREVHGAVGSRVTLHCSFWSSEWVSDDISFTWRYQPEGGRDAISVSAWKNPGFGQQKGYFKEQKRELGLRKGKSFISHNANCRQVKW